MVLPIVVILKELVFGKRYFEAITCARPRPERTISKLTYFAVTNPTHERALVRPFKLIFKTDTRNPSCYTVS
jgi:hypothetical protein